MIPEDIHANDGLVEVGVRALRNIVVEVLLIAKRIHSLEDEVEQGLQVLWTGTGNEDIRVPVRKRSSDSEAQSSRLSTPTASS